VVDAVRRVGQDQVDRGEVEVAENLLVSAAEDLDGAVVVDRDRPSMVQFRPCFRG